MASIPDAEVPGDAPPGFKSLRDRITGVVAEVVEELGDAPDADPDDLLRDVVYTVGQRLNESICTEAEYEGGAEAVAAEVARELINVRNVQRRAKATVRPAPRAARARRGVSRSPGDSGGTNPPAAQDPPAGEDPPPAEDPPGAEDVPSPRGVPLDIAAIVAAHVERVSAPLRERLVDVERDVAALLDDNQRLRARIDAIEGMGAPEPAIEGRVLPVQSHSDDFASVRWSGQTFVFTALQAAVVAVLWRAWEAGTPVLRTETIGDRAGSAADRFRLDLLFRGHPALGTLIVRAGKGLWSIGPAPTSAENARRNHRSRTVAAPRRAHRRRA